MSAVNGYDTAYYAIGPIHQDLNVGGAGGTEFEFLSGYSEDPYSDKPMMSWDEWMRWILFNEIHKIPKVSNEIMTKAISEQAKTLPYNSTTNNKQKSVYDVLSLMPELSKMKDLVDYVGYGKIFEQGNSFFLPINTNFDKILTYQLTIAYKPVAALQVLRYHILPYIIKPWQMENRKLKMRTDLDQQPIESDWTRGKRLLINPINDEYLSPPAGSYTNPPGDPVPARTDNWFPKISWEVEILEVLECAGGNMVYIIDRPIIWSDFM